MKLDLETLKQVKTMFGYHSDYSTNCNGYHSLCKMIEEAENIVNKNNIQHISIGQTQPNKMCDCSRKYNYTASVVCDAKCKEESLMENNFINARKFIKEKMPKHFYGGEARQQEIARCMIDYYKEVSRKSI